MTLALVPRAAGPGATHEALAALAREAGVPHLVLDDPPAAASRWREPLQASGVRVVALRLSVEGAPSDTALALAGALRVERVVVGGGRLEPLPGMGAAPSEAEREAQRLRTRERQVESLARRLHGSVSAGAPLAVRHGATEADLLRLDEVGWLLDALPRLMLWLDPARLLAASREGWSPGPLAWADRLAGRVAGLSVHGLGSDGRGHAHPEDDGPPWGTLASCLPRRVPWALDLSGRLDARDVGDARRFLEAVFAEPG